MASILIEKLSHKKAQFEIQTGLFYILKYLLLK